MKNLLIYLGVLYFSVSAAQIGINTPTPNTKAELDISSTNKGILIPRFTRVTPNPLVTPQIYAFGTIPTVGANNGMLVYQTNTLSTNLPGFYFNNFGWFPLRVTNGWSLNGNTGINPTLNYVGTPDAFPLRFRTSNLERMAILADGKIGIGVVAPTTNLHLVGTPTTTLKIEDGFAAAGNYLSSTADGTTIWRTPASLGFAGWSVTGNAGTSSASNFLGTSDAQDLIISTLGTEKMRVQADGNVRINTAGATLSQLQVTSNTTSSPAIRAINTNLTPNTFSFGINGEVQAKNPGSYAVRGESVDVDGVTSGIGVLGQTQGLFGAAVFGRAWIDLQGINTVLNYNPANYVDFLPNRNYGVYGLVNFDTGKGVLGFNSNTTIGSAYGMYCSGNMAVAVGLTQAPTIKSASVPTAKGNQLVYCKESPEMWFEDFGFGQLQNGRVHIAMDALFLETVFIDNAHKMHVVLQEQDDSNGLYVVVDADFKGFTVKEKKSGTSNAAFSYSIMAKRRFYQDQRFGVDANQPYGNNLIGMKDAEIATTDPMVVKAFVEKITREKNEQYAASLK
jgi:hypothetical protein